MELRQLRHFVAVIECGNLSAASGRTNISQPALTRSIQNLEDTLGSKLLLRNPRGVAPTLAGEAFYRYALLILNESRLAEENIRAIASGVLGNVAIGIAALFATTIVDRAVTRLTADRPGLTLSVTEGYYEDLTRMLLEGKIDVIFSNFPVTVLPAGLVAEPLINLKSVVACGAKHPLARRRRVSLTELTSQRWVIVDQPHVADIFQHAFGSKGVAAPSPVVKTNSINLMRSLLLNNGFVTFLPTNFIRDELAKGAIVEVRSPVAPLTRKAGLIFRDQAHRRRAVSLFIEEIRLACSKVK